MTRSFPDHPRKTGLRKQAWTLVFLAFLGGCDAAERIARGGVVGVNLADRAPPPGLDAPWGNLGQVPARPDRPDPQMRRALDASLVADRAAAADPLGPRATPAAAGQALGGEVPIPSGPPARAALRAAPPVPWGRAARPEPVPEIGVAPALPMPDLLAPAPPVLR